MNQFIVYCLKLIQQTDIYKAELAELKKQFLDYRKAMKNTKANKCKYYKYDSFYLLSENKCCSISDRPRCCGLLLGEECGAFRRKSSYKKKGRKFNERQICKI